MDWHAIVAGLAAGAGNGLFGAGGGMVLVPILSGSKTISNDEVFSSSIVIIFPICLVSLFTGTSGSLPWSEAWPFLVGGTLGGIAAATIGRRLRPIWLHRILGLLILYGGIRYLC